MSVPTAAQEAAAQIMALINSRPTSPRLDEIAAILAGFIPAPAAASAKAAEWRRAVAEMRDGIAARELEYERLGKKATEADLVKIADLEALIDRACKVSQSIWAAGAGSLADIALFAEIALHWA